MVSVSTVIGACSLILLAVRRSDHNLERGDFGSRRSDAQGPISSPSLRESSSILGHSMGKTFTAFGYFFQKNDPPSKGIRELDPFFRVKLLRRISLQIQF